MPTSRKIVFIMVDTQRWDMLGCYGNPDLKTPNLDRLAGEGIRFDRAYTCQPVCGPARAALFTGTWPHTNGSWGNSMPLGQTIRTLGQRLANANLHTAYIGKWHLDGGDYFGYGICPEGWDPDYWYDMRTYLEELPEEERLRSRQFATCLEEGFSEEFTYGNRCSNRAIDFLEKHAEEDFCLVVSYDEPHGPCLCPAPFNTMYRDYEFPKTPSVWDRLENKPAHQKAWAGNAVNRDNEALKIKRAAFFGCNSYVDYEIGRVLAAIERHAPDALVVYTADHGDALASHSIGGKGPAMYDEITRIPFLVRWPGVAPAGTVCPHPVSHIDVVPTLLAAAGAAVPPCLEGKSMVPTFADPTARPNDCVFMEFNRYEVDHDCFGGFQPVRCAFDGRYKFVLNLLCEDELYDLETDPYELANLLDSPDHAAIRDRLHDRLLQWMNETRDPFRGYYWERRPWRTDARPATWGYTGMTRQREDDPEYEPRQLDYDTGLAMKTATRGK